MRRLERSRTVIYTRSFLVTQGVHVQKTLPTPQSEAPPVDPACPDAMAFHAEHAARDGVYVPRVSPRRAFIAQTPIDMCFEDSTLRLAPGDALVEAGRDGLVHLDRDRFARTYAVLPPERCESAHDRRDAAQEALEARLADPSRDAPTHDQDTRIRAAAERRMARVRARIRTARERD